MIKDYGSSERQLLQNEFKPIDWIAGPWSSFEEFNENLSHFFIPIEAIPDGTKIRIVSGNSFKEYYRLNNAWSEIKSDVDVSGENLGNSGYKINVGDKSLTIPQASSNTAGVVGPSTISKIQELETKTDNLSGKINTVSDKANKSERDISGINSNIQTISGRISDNESKINEIESKENDLEDNINHNTENIENLQIQNDLQNDDLERATFTDGTDFEYAPSVEEAVIEGANRAVEFADKAATEVVKAHAQLKEIHKTLESIQMSEDVDEGVAAAIATNAGNINKLTEQLNEKPNKEDLKNIADFQKELGSIEDNPEFIKVVVDSNRRILFGIKENGDCFFGFGIPNQIQNKIAEVVNTLINSQNRLSDIEDVVGQYANIEEFIEVKVDSEKHIIYGVKPNGSVYIPKLETPHLDNLDNIISAVERNTADIENIKKGSSAYPSYYNQYINDKIEKINNSEFEEGINSDSFIFFTDTHVKYNSMQSPNLMQELLKRTNCKKAIWGGDAIWAYTDNRTDSIEDCKDKIISEWETQQNSFYSAISPYGNLYNVRGNHDFTIRILDSDLSERFNKGYTYSKATCFNNIMRSSINNPKIKFNKNDNGCYYFFDEDYSKIRYIILDGQSKDNSSTEGNYAWGNDSGMGISNNQLQWIKTNALLTLPDNYSIIVVMHEGLVPEIAKNTFDNYNTFVNELQNLKYKRNEYTNINVNKIVVFNGHEHLDDQVYINDILYISTANDFAEPDCNNSKFFKPITRPVGSIREQLFDFVSTDFSNSIVKCFRIGGGYDRYFNTNKITISVGNKVSLSVRNINPVSYNSYNAKGNTFSNGSWNIINNIVSVSSNGEVSALSVGEAVVFAKDENDNKEFFYINVIS